MLAKNGMLLKDMMSEMAVNFLWRFCMDGVIWQKLVMMYISVLLIVSHFKELTSGTNILLDMVMYSRVPGKLLSRPVRIIYLKSQGDGLPTTAQIRRA